MLLKPPKSMPASKYGEHREDGIRDCLLSRGLGDVYKRQDYYRADWEPAATSGKCMAGVPGVFWRSPVVLWGPTTHNPALVLRNPLILKNWPIFPMCMWKWGGSAPSGQARVSRPNWPQCAKSDAAWQSLSSRAEKLRISHNKIIF